MVRRALLPFLLVAAVVACGSAPSDEDLLSGRACAEGSGLGRAVEGPVDPAVDLAPALGVARELVGLRGNVSSDDSPAERRSRLEALTAGPSRPTRTESVEEALAGSRSVATTILEERVLRADAAKVAVQIIAREERRYRPGPGGEATFLAGYSFDLELVPEGWRVTGSAYASTGPC